MTKLEFKEDMICSGVRVLEDPYDYVMRKSDTMKIKIVPSTSTGRKTNNDSHCKMCMF